MENPPLSRPESDSTVGWGGGNVTSYKLLKLVTWWVGFLPRMSPPLAMVAKTTAPKPYKKTKPLCITTA